METETMRTEEDMIAYALEVDPSLLPLIPELLRGFDELGSDGDAILAALRSIDLPTSATAVDLGCGKGVISVKIASELGIRTTGVELFEPFIAECEMRAEAAGVGDLCDFIHGNIVKQAGALPPADVAIYAALGDVLGPPPETMAIVSRFVKPGGFVLISDGFVREGGSADFTGFEYATSRDDVLAGWMAHGDHLVLESLARDDDGGEAEVIKRNVESLALRYPELKDKLLQFARDQQAEYDFLEQNFVSAVWVFQVLGE
jgi:SAM-dependent methyltransferase